VVQKDDDCWALYTAVFNEVVATGRASGISIPAEKAEARLARARTGPPMVLFLASPHASAITGQSIAIDGGSTPGIFY